jgi:hypothetical protein
VVEASLAYQSVKRIEWTLYRSDEWVKKWTLQKTTQRKRGPLVVWTDTSDEISVCALQTRLNH